MRKLITIIIFYIISISVGIAETCPTIQDIKNGNFHAWRLYDSDSHQPLNTKYVPQFKQYAQQFTLAEWHKDSKQRNIIRCYYRDFNGSEARAYLAKKDFHPEIVKNTWYSVSGSLHCAAGRNHCVFQNNQSSHQLARNDSPG